MVKMLDISKANYFKYQAQDAIDDSDIDDRVGNSLLASVISKASRSSIADAKEYIHDKDDDGTLPEDLAHTLLGLLDRYQTWR